MPIPHHEDVELVPGDDWAIPGILTDADGGALDLTAATFEWRMLDFDGVVVSTSAQIATESPATAGKITINMPKTTTVAFNPGRYADVLRVTISDLTQTVWVGSILVAANAFSVPQ